MTAPTPEDQKAAAEKAAASKASGKAANVLDVVEYPHRDLILGRESRRLGVLVAVDGDTGEVVPLEHYRVRVPLADVTPVSDSEV